MTAINPMVNGTPAYKLQIHWMLGEPEDISYTFYGPDAAAMLAGQLPPNNGRLACSFGSGTDAVLLSNGTQLVYDQPGYVSETGKSIGIALQQSAIIHRFTAQQITLQDAFNGQANAIQIQATNPDVIVPLLPDQAGIAATPIGVLGRHTDLAFQFILDGAIQSQVLDVDINEDNLLHATQTIMERMGSFVDPQQTQLVIDSGPQTVTLGKKGGNTCTFGTDAVPVLRATTAQAQTTDLCASCTFTGGDSHHGLPATGKITGLVAAITPPIGDAALVSVYAAVDVGGVYFWRGDGAFYPMSQAMGVNSIWVDNFTNYLCYAATDAGVYAKAPNTFSTEPFGRLGAMSLKCHKVQQENNVVYCLAEFKGSAAPHVLAYTPGTTTGVGYNDWTDTVSAQISDFAVMGDYCYGILPHLPGVLLTHQLSTGAQDQIVLSTGASIIGLDAVSQRGNTTSCVMIRTDQGSSELYYLTPGSTTPLRANMDHSLTDRYGAPVMVNSICANAQGTLECTTGLANSALLASTSLGVFSCPLGTGAGQWQRTDGQSSIGDFVCTFAASVDGQHCYAASDTVFFVSQNGSVNWIDAFSQPLDAGPYFYDHFWTQFNRLPLDTETSIPVPYGGGDYLLQRVLSGIGVWSYHLVNPNSAAPADQHRSAELSEISTSALMSPITASRLLVEGMARFLAYTARPQVIVEVESFFTDDSSPLRTLRPTDAAVVIGQPMEYLIAPAQVPFAIGSYSGEYFVLEHTITHDRDADRNACTTHTRLGTLLLNDRSDPMKISADLQYQVSRLQTYKSKARH